GEVTMRRLFARPDSPRRFRTRVEELEVRAQPALLSVAVSFPALLGVEAQVSFFAVSARVGAGTSLPAQANETAQIAFAPHPPDATAATASTATALAPDAPTTLAVPQVAGAAPAAPAPIPYLGDLPADTRPDLFGNASAPVAVYDGATSRPAVAFVGAAAQPG